MIFFRLPCHMIDCDHNVRATWFPCIVFLGSWCQCARAMVPCIEHNVHVMKASLRVSSDARVPSSSECNEIIVIHISRNEMLAHTRTDAMHATHNNTSLQIHNKEACASTHTHWSNITACMHVRTRATHTQQHISVHTPQTRRKLHADTRTHNLQHANAHASKRSTHEHTHTHTHTRAQHANTNTQAFLIY
jgi:hypothetical protein